MSNIEALQAKLPDEACGALITSDDSRRYFCGFKSSAGVILETLFRQGEAARHRLPRDTS